MAILPANPTATMTAELTFGPMTDEQKAAAGLALADPETGPGRAVVNALAAWINDHPELDATAAIAVNIGGAVTLVYEAPPPAP